MWALAGKNKEAAIGEPLDFYASELELLRKEARQCRAQMEVRGGRWWRCVREVVEGGGVKSRCGGR